MEQYRTGFLPIRSDNFPYKGESVQEARRYALRGEGQIEYKKVNVIYTCQPSCNFSLLQVLGLL